MKQSSKTISNIPTKELIIFETIELELGLTTTDEDFDKIYKCPIFMHKDESKVGRYFATHRAGVHSVAISFVDDLENFLKGPDGNEMILIYMRIWMYFLWGFCRCGTVTRFIYAAINR